MLELHELKDGEPYWICLFLGGAYQEVMGNLHNLFGSTNAVSIRLSPGGPYRVEHVVRGQTNSDVLEAMEHDPEALLERLRQASEEAIGSGDLSISAARRLMHYTWKAACGKPLTSRNKSSAIKEIEAGPTCGATNHNWKPSVSA